MSWFNPVAIVFFIAFLFPGIVAAMYLFSGIRLFMIGTREANFVKRKSAVLTIMISGACLSLIILQIFQIGRFVRWFFP
jgi:hypothetical protein